MNRYSTIIKNDTTNGLGVCVSFWVQGCPHHCPDCFNPETWDFYDGAPYTEDTKKEVISAINANNLQRNLSILGGEPLAEENLSMVVDLIKEAKATYPTIQIFIWTGFYLRQLPKNNKYINFILDNTTYLIDGPFIRERKNLNLPLRGSDNQSIWYQVEPKKWEVINSKWKTLL